MATTYLRAESANANPRAAIMARLFNRHSEREISDAIEVMVDVLDLLHGNPDLEEGGDDEPREAEGDSRDAAWVEWNAMRGSQKRGPNILAGQEDDEDDDPAEQDDDSGQCDEDGVNTALDAVRFTYGASGPGCILSDSDKGGEEDGEIEDGM